MGKIKSSAVLLLLLTSICCSFLLWRNKVENSFTLSTKYNIIPSYLDEFYYSEISDNTAYVSIQCLCNILYNATNAGYSYTISEPESFIDIMLKSNDIEKPDYRILYNINTSKVYFISSEYESSWKIKEFIYAVD